jgi:preprotein translocase subunit YajC
VSGGRVKVMQMQVLCALIFQSPAGGGTSWLAWAPLVFIFLIFYFLLILPQQRRQKQWKSMLGELKTGDRVTTSGGLRGTIVALRDDNIHLRVPPDNIRLEVARSSIVSVSSGDEPAKTQ